uniref:Chloroplast 50S ribosomal protein L19 n=1 Tax=Acetabularia acetabulum TaxID=35845 RepID=W6MCI9_ACEAT|nr:chloroplast 50S ribosomal protein L19 [Acetabularia acetabulum]
MTKKFLKLIKNIEHNQLKKQVQSPSGVLDIFENEKFKKGNVARIKTFLQEMDPNTGQKKYNQLKVQTFEGIITKIHRAGLNSTIKITRLSKGVQIERIFLLYSPILQSIEIL